jgi:hypothetical protein
MKNILSIAIVGGHPDTSRNVSESSNLKQLEQTCKKQIQIVRLPGSRNSSSKTREIKSKILNCQLIFLILRYGGHDLSNIVLNLKRKGRIKGEVITLAYSIGRTGLLEEIKNQILSLK